MINDRNKNSWCVNADHAMSANNNGTTKICCMIKNEEVMGLSDNTIDENFNKIEFMKIREALNNGIRHNDCNLCWKEENSGRKSKRLRDNEKYLNSLRDGGEPFTGLAKFELNLGNTCNLKCRTCAPHSSSQWMKEYFDIYEAPRYNNDYKRYTINMKKYHQTFDDDSPFWDDLIKNLPTIRQLDFYGGEPFMSKKMWRTLEIAVELGYSKNIELHYATNGTQWPADKIELFRHFRHLNLNFSIDGIGKQFEYLRDQAIWEEVRTNMENARAFKKTHHDMQLSWCVTLSTMNIYNLPETLHYFSSMCEDDFGIFLNLVHGPIHFNISRMHPDIKDAVINRLETFPRDGIEDIWNSYLPGIINFIKNGNYNERDWKAFKDTIKVHDDYRGQSFSATFPEYAKIIGI